MRTMHEPAMKKSKEVDATPEEVTQAIESLTPAELNKLHDYARTRIFSLGRHAGSADAGDLLQEAVRRVLEEKRHWKPAKVDFVGFLIGVMKSIASSWKTRAERNPPTIRDSDFAETDDGAESNPFELAADTRPDALRQLMDGDLPTQEWLVHEIEQLFSEDPICSLICGAWGDGDNGPEIMKTLELTRTQYDTAVRRIDRKIHKRWPDGRPNVL
jgi:DNA-directed RNA polymerase specialized sigma24 family protein